MYKKLSIALLGILIFAGSAQAFTVTVPIADQIDTLDGVTLSTDQIQLSDSASQLQKLFINPHFPTWRDMYLSTENGIYINSQYNPQWAKHTQLSELFPNGFTEIAFDGKYSTTRIMLAYSSDKIYLTYNNGDAWSDITPDITEPILFADLGPNFGSNEQIYFITESGLYQTSLSTNNISTIVDATSPGSVRNFRYVRPYANDSEFYIVNDNVVSKTINMGTSFNDYAFDTTITDFEILPSGHLIVLTDDNKLHYATVGFNFYELTLPSEINVISQASTIIHTDQGFYISYTGGDNWTKLDYDPSLIVDLKDYDYVVDGTQTSLYIMSNGNLYRDYDLVETLEEYMTGLDSQSVYSSEGTVVSKNILDLSTDSFDPSLVVSSAMLTADGDLNGQNVDFYITADGANWEPVEQGVTYDLAAAGQMLQWKAVLSTTDPGVTPVLRAVNIDFGLDELVGCAGFADIPVDDPHCPAIQYVQQNGIFSGYPDGTFQPDAEINRAETVKVIVEGFDITLLEADGTDLGFSDVGVNEWYMGYLNTAFNAGVIEGYPDGTFKPNNTVIYVEMLKIFFETADVVVEPAGPAADWYEKYVNYAYVNNLVPYDDVTTGMKRVDVAELFYQWSLL